MKYTGTLVDHDHVVVGEGSLVPGAVFKVRYVAFISFDIAKANAAPVNVSFFHADLPSNRATIADLFMIFDTIMKGFIEIVNNLEGYYFFVNRLVVK